MSQRRNNWEVSYSSITWMEGALGSHMRVQTFVRSDDIVFDIQRTDSLSAIRAAMVSRYVIGVADVIEAQGEFPGINCIFTSGDWYGYTREAKEYGLENGVSVFQLGEFMGALWQADVLHHARKDEKGNPVYAFKSSKPD